MILKPESPIASSFVEASHYTRSRRAKIDLFVIHTAEDAQTSKSAENLGGYFHIGGTHVSAHYSADLDSIVQSVPEAAPAWAAGHEGNVRGIHVELAGRAAETGLDWSSPANASMLELVAKLAADVCARWDIPIAFVDAEAIMRGERGITTHAEISRAWKETDHTDPGASFPMNDFVAKCIEARSASEYADTDPPPAAT